MVKRGTARLARLATVVFVGFVMAQTPEAMAGEALWWGINGHPFTAYPGVTIEQQIDLVASLGMRSYRVNVTRIDQMEGLAHLIAVASARHVQILPVLIPPANFERDTGPVLYTKAYNFARAFVSHFQADIPVWELGNELENYAIIKPCEMRDDGTKYPCEWGPAGGVGPLEYYGPRAEKVIAVLHGLSDGVRSVSTTARRAIGSAGWGHTGIFDRLRDKGVEWDISVWHMYSASSGNEWAFKRLAAFGKPIWITEFNHPLGSAKDGEEGQAQGLHDVMLGLSALASRYDIEAAFIYELLDETYWAPSYEASMGLVKLSPLPGGHWTLGQHKSAFDAVKKTIALDIR
jgi:hypothetical protein